MGKLGLLGGDEGVGTVLGIYLVHSLRACVDGKVCDYVYFLFSL
jgi:hypothetical protein